MASCKTFSTPLGREISERDCRSLWFQVGCGYAGHLIASERELQAQHSLVFSDELLELERQRLDETRVIRTPIEAIRCHTMSYDVIQCRRQQGLAIANLQPLVEPSTAKISSHSSPGSKSH